MSILIKKVGDKFIAKATPPDSDKGNWETQEPLDVHELVRQLMAIGCHGIDIGNELYKIDPKLIGL